MEDRVDIIALLQFVDPEVAEWLRNNRLQASSDIDQFIAESYNLEVKLRERDRESG